VSDASRNKLVGAAREAWVKRLIDPSRANTLLFFRDLKVGMLELPVESHAVAALLEGGEAKSSDLGRALPQAKPEAIARSIKTVREKAISNREEKGVDTLQLALGMATWPALDGGRPYNAPVLLVPLRIESRGQGGHDMLLQVAGEPRLNPVLEHVLREDYQVEIDGAALVDSCSTENDEGAWTVHPSQLYAGLRQIVSTKIDQFQVVPRALVANFHFARMSMVEDLRRNGSQLAASDLVAAVAGDVATRDRLGKVGASFAPRYDQRTPDEDYFVLLSDSTQQAAIEAAEQGLNLVVQGPPGTGKSQTIANLIAQAVARGQRVLFVAEKRAALDAVIKRLSHKDVGLGHLILDLHGASVSRKQVMASLKLALDQMDASLAPQGVEALHREFDERRRELNEHARRINTPLAPLGLAPVHILGALVRLTPAAHTRLRMDSSSWRKLTPESLHSVRETMRDMATRPALHLGTSASPWNQARLYDSAAAARALELSRSAAREALPQLRAALAHAAADAGIAAPRSLSAAIALAEVLREAAVLHQSLQPEVYAADPAALARALAPARKSWMARTMAFVLDGAYRSARARLRSLLRGTPPPVSGLLDLAEQAAAHATRWRAFSTTSAPPAPSTATESLRATAERLTAVCDELRQLVPDLANALADLDTLEAQLTALTNDVETAFQIPEVRQHQARLRDAGFGPLVDELRVQAVDTNLYAERTEHFVLATALEAVYSAEPKLASFRGSAHQDIVQRFRELDAQRMQLAAHRVRRLHAQSVIAAMNAHPTEDQLVRREASKKARHKPLRQLLEEAPHVLTRLAPCWVASPLSVSQLLAASNNHFDLVVFDEGSQIPPEDAVPALYRARQVVAAGDQHQMPPTPFFATAVDADDMGTNDAGANAAVDATQLQAEESIAGFESLLAALESFLPNRMLSWHYRSEDERLIAFSNNEVYSKRLVTFPGARAHLAITHELVAPEASPNGAEESTTREVERVVELVLEHARTRPTESLGVITMGIKHCNRVQSALDKRLHELASTEPQLRAFFDVARDERFFVKNLETVQGDERDAILLSIGYGKDASGNVPLRFGPLLQESGYRRLNVAITRAKRRMCVVSSFRADELDLGRSSARGLAMLKGYLQYAQAGGERMVGPDRTDEQPLSDLELDIRNALEAKGLTLRAHYGASRFRIELVALHPDRPGQPILAIECDGSSYNASSTARDRDRLRQHHLERLGWTYHRIWATDWCRNREAEVERVLSAYRRAIAGTPATTEAQPPPSTDQAKPTTAPPTRSLPKPRLRQRDAITDYPPHELVALVRWIQSDGILRTDEELIREAFEELPFQQLGSRIRQCLAEAVERAKRG
jgi:hypothetical protein